MGSTSEKTDSPPCAKLPTTATVAALEEALLQVSREMGAEPDRLDVDLTQCDYVEPAALVYFLSVLAARRGKRLETRLCLPRSKDVRDFLRVWNFPAAVRHVAGQSFSALVPPEDLQFFGENPTPATMKYAGRLLDEGVERLVSDKFFALMTFLPEQIRSRTRLVVNESARWEEKLVRSVLATHLNGPDGYVASRIVFESMMNAVRHPRARHIVTTSKFDAPGECQADSKGHLTLIYWDDGTSMFTTLMEAIIAGKEVRSTTVPELSAGYQLTIVDENGVRQPPSLVNSDLVPNRSMPRPVVLLSTLFPGVTCDVTGTGHEVHEELRRARPEYALPGMGLAALVNAVVDVFSGNLAVRTLDFFMSVKKAYKKDKGAKYRAKIALFDPKIGNFLGNMLTIRLPLRDKAPL